MPNIFAECLLAAPRFAALFIVFYLLHRPRTPLRRVLAVCIMVLLYPFHRILFFASSGNFAASVVCNTLFFLTLAFICETEASGGSPGQASPVADGSGKFGDFMRPVISALYSSGMLLLFNYILFCYMYAFYGSAPPSFSLWAYFWKTVEGIFFLLWTYFYYRIARNVTAKAPVSFSLLTILTPLAGLAVIAASTNETRLLLDYGVNIFLYGGLFGTLIIVLNMCVFYLYTKLSVAHEALISARDLAHTPPVWTPEQGLSVGFIEKYEITPREREVVEAMLQGKTDKEIAAALNIAVNTVQVHLKRIYRKTGAAGRFALSALVRGG
jgi:DNA-binding CsgD family transcriptional regulator